LIPVPIPVPAFTFLFTFATFGMSVILIHFTPSRARAR
jgi:hypothetical protein